MFGSGPPGRDACWMDSGRQHHLDVVKGLAISAIVLVHADAVLPKHAVDGIGAAASIALAALFLVSGHVAGRRLLDDSVGSRAVITRIAPLLWLYIVWQPMVLLQRIVLAGGRGCPIDLTAEAGRLLASPVRPNGELWYLWALALHLVLVRATRRSAPLPVLLPAAALFVLCAGFGEHLVGEHAWHVLGPGVQGLPQFAFFTLLGSRMRALPPRWLRSVKRLTAVGCAAAAVLIAVQAAGPPLLLRPVQTTTGVVLMLALADLAARSRFTNGITEVGQCSVVPYLTHMSLLTLVVTGLVHAGWVPVAPSARPAVLAAVVCVAVVFPVVGHRLVRRTRMRWLFHVPPVVVDRSADLVELQLARWRSRRDLG